MIVKNEMGWTKLWFIKQQNIWRDRGEKSHIANRPGHEAYAKKQVAMWKQFEAKARDAFRGLDTGGVSS